MAPFILPKTGAIFGRPSARMARYLYVTDLAKPEADEAEDGTIRQRDSEFLLRLHADIAFPCAPGNSP